MSYDELLIEYSVNHRNDLSHTSMATARVAGDQGRYIVPFIENDRFFNVYTKLIGKRELCLTESHLEGYGPVIIDLDYRFARLPPTRLIGLPQIRKIVSVLTDGLRCMFGVDARLDCFVLQRPEMYPKGNLFADGLHLQFPYVICKFEYQLALRRYFIAHYQMNIEGYGIQTDLEQIYDEKVIKSTGRWLMYGSTKPGIKPYRLKWIFNTNRDPADLSEFHDDNGKLDHATLARLLSIRRGDPKTEPIDFDIINDYEKTIKDSLLNKKRTKPRGLNEIKAEQGQPLVIGQTIFDEILIRMLLARLNRSRVEHYDEWLTIIIILNHCHVDQKPLEPMNPRVLIDFKKLAHDWSSQSQKYDRADLDYVWHYFLQHPSGYRVPRTIRSLFYFARRDKPKLYREIELYQWLITQRPYLKMAMKRICMEPTSVTAKLTIDACPHCQLNTLYLQLMAERGLEVWCMNCRQVKSTSEVSDHKLIQFGLDPTKRPPQPINPDDTFLYFHRKGKYNFTNEKENSVYISDKMVNTILNFEIAIVNSPPGSGKTYAINKILNSYQHRPTFLSVISRRTMSAQHKKSFSAHGITSYLDPEDEWNYKGFIISLEQLYKLNNFEYVPDFLILDEITSLLAHFRSSTMNASRLASFFYFIYLLKHAKRIILCDGIITDVALTLIHHIRPQSVIFYQNEFKNKINTKLIIYHRRQEKMAVALEAFCQLILEEIATHPQTLIMADSKTIVDDIHCYLLDRQSHLPKKHRLSRDDFLVYTKDSGKLDDIMNCDEVWPGHVVLYSPKIVYGIDCHVPYRRIFAVYFGRTIDSLAMHQQLCRARDADELVVLFLNPDKQTNTVISYDENREREQRNLESYISQMKKTYTPNQMDAARAKIVKNDFMFADIDGKCLINDDSLYNELYLLQSWYDHKFDGTKAQLLEAFFRERGSQIIHRELELLPKGSICQFTSNKKAVNEEWMKQAVSALKKEKHDDKNDHTGIDQRWDIINEKLSLRLKIFRLSAQNLIQNPKLRAVILDDVLIKRAFLSFNLYLTPEKVADKKLTAYVKNFPQLEMEKYLYSFIQAIHQLEIIFNKPWNLFHKLKIKQKHIARYQTTMLAQMDILNWVNSNKKIELRRIRVKNAIDKITRPDQLMQYLMRIINRCDKFYVWKPNVQGSKRLTHYINVQFDQTLTQTHFKLINLLRMKKTDFRPEFHSFFKAATPKIDDVNFLPDA